ncbi:MAG: alpha/beta hydrolase-fold protein [Spirosomaceae bacterium]|nr:alpha/beta hydrolase-fold protein [Spirosomataceae bacterium]
MSQFFTTEIASFGGLDFITVKSNALQRRADITVFNPVTDDSARNVPLVILLHGVYGSHWAWAVKGQVHQTAQRLINEAQIRPMLLAMPSDGLYADGSGYVPHRTANYEKWIVEDVIQVLKEQYAVLSDDSPIFITGLSMGGFGALRLGAKYPQLFKSFSGLSSITHFEQIGLFVKDFQQLRLDAIEQDGVLDWLLKHQSRLPLFRFDCGIEDPLIEHNRTLHTALTSHQIPHLYEEYKGGHTWGYWEEHIEQTLLFFEKQY